MKTLYGLAFASVLLFTTAAAHAQTTFTDNFNVTANFLTTGVAGTMWDGVYLGAGDVANATGAGAAAGSVSLANANNTAAGLLTVTSTQTDWENANDDGFMLFKTITGDFDMSVRVVAPVNTNNYNLPGLMVRAYGANGAPAPGGRENSLLWARFNEYGIANMLKNNTNGVKTDTGKGTNPNTNFWLRITRVGNLFTVYEKGPAGAAWTNVGTVSRGDFAGLPLQVGIEHSDYSAAVLTAQYASFSLIVSNLASGVAPSAASGLTITTNTDNSASLAWTPGNGLGSVMVLWSGSAAVREAPANGMSYTGNASYGSGSSLPAVNYYVVYAGTGASVTVSNLIAGTTYYAAVFSYAGSGSTLTYTHTPATGNFTIASGGGGGGGGGNATTFADNFSANNDYFANGIVGTMWDGVYLGAGEFNNSGVGGGGAGATLQCNANISAPNTLTLQTTGTAWENVDDDGFFLFKVLQGDFSVMAHVVSPFNAGAYNTAGLQVRLFSPGGDPYNGSENYVSWARFNEFNIPNDLRSEVNGAVNGINPGDYPNGAYWIRVDRVNGTNFTFYQRTNNVLPWQPVTFPGPVNGTVLRRADFAGKPVEVGLMHATFGGQLGVQFSDFTLYASNVAFAPAPSPASNLVIGTNADETLSLTWTPGPGSDGSLVAVWTSTNRVQEMPANGFIYAANAGYGLGGTLPGATYYVVYAGTNSSVIVSNVIPGTTYYAAVYSYAGSSPTNSYSHTPATGSVTLEQRGVSGTASLITGDVSVTFSANPGEWYWLEYSDTINPGVWHRVGVLPTIATNLYMTMVHHGGAGASQRFYRLEQDDPAFGLQTGNGTINSLAFTGDSFSTQYLSGALGAVTVKYGTDGVNWTTAKTAPVSGATATYSTSPDGTVRKANYQMTTGLSGPLVLESDFNVQQAFITWTLSFTNTGATPVIIGDLAIPFPMNTGSPQYTTGVFKHSVVSGSGSFIFWMRNNSVGPYLLMTPDENTPFEFWDTRAAGGVYEAFIHSAAAQPLAAAQYPTVTNSNVRWRFPATSATLAPGASVTHTLKFQWANDYDGVRQALVDEGKIDVHVVPGMTVPTNLFAEIALNTTQQITAITAEFPSATTIQPVGSNGNYQLYKAQFAQLGENMLTINYGSNQTTSLEFFVTEPVETLFKKRAAFLVNHQQWVNPSLWYSGLFGDWNENDQVLNSPSNYDTISGFVVYEVASDDAGESRPAYMAEKESLYPVQSEVSALDLYITNFVWPAGATGGLQRKTNETSSYGVYGINDWKQLRTAGSLSLGRTYDYPHIVDMYFAMYKTAKYNPQITTAWTATNYLKNAWGTALAMYTVAGAGSSTPPLMSEMVYADLLDALHAEGMTNEEAQLRPHWESKVAYYSAGNRDLFGSEYGFDSTGFEATQAFARYAVEHAGTDATMGSANPAEFLQNAQNFMLTQVTANMFDRGFLETAYYHYGSDFRSGGSDNFCLSYMTQMGGWGLLDYAEYYAPTAVDFLRLGYGSYLAGWGIMNTGTPESNYGFWYHGAANDGACGGGYEPQAYFNTWLGQPTHRGPWYYSAEQNIGFCGAVRSGATILADDPIFGRFCYGGTMTTNGSLLQMIPLDGVRRRFHALLTNGVLHVTLDADRFAAAQPLVLNPDLSAMTVQLESDNPAAHTVPLHLSSSATEPFTITSNSVTVASGTLTAGQDTVVNLPMPSGSAATFSITF